MPKVAFQAGWFAWVLFLLFWLCLVLAGPSTKFAGAAWLCLCLIGVYASLRGERRPAGAAPSRMAGAAGIWLLACVLSMGLEAVMIVYWHEGWEQQHARFRLLLAALAAFALTRRQLPVPVFHRGTLAAIGIACVVAFGVGISGFQERSFPSHPIPWSAGISFLVCLVLPVALFDSQLGVTWRRALGTCALLGTFAVLLSMSRGVYGIAAWTALLGGLALWRAFRPKGGLKSNKATLTVAAAAALAIVIVGALSAERIQDHVELAVDEFSEAWTADSPDDYDNSVGSRIYLWKAAAGWVKASPWVGIGAEARLSSIQEAGRRMHVPTVAGLGHLHNEYLNAQVDHGLVGLVSLLTLQAGLLAVIMFLWRTHRITAWQIGGILFMHSVCGLSNVNFAHNYYGTMMAMSVTISLFAATFSRPSRTCA